MKIINASYNIETPREWFKESTHILERAGRVCYKSEGKICDGSDVVFLSKLMTLEHFSVVEHFNATVRFICDRGVSHELVRHRLCSFSQESTRYCNYSNEKFGNEITVIQPCFFAEGSLAWSTWWAACKVAEDNYFSLLKMGAKPQEARSVLPNSLKTEVMVTANLREWHHIFTMRTSPKAHPQMRELMVPLLAEFKELVPVIYDKLSA